jgi:hypothetical protein
MKKSNVMGDSDILKSYKDLQLALDGNIDEVDLLEEVKNAK